MKTSMKINQFNYPSSFQKKSLEISHILEKSFMVWHACLSSCHSILLEMCFVGRLAMFFIISLTRAMEIKLLTLMKYSIEHEHSIVCSAVIFAHMDSRLTNS